MSSFHLQIVTPDGSFFDGEANSVVVRTTGGYVSIYPHHTDYIAALDIGRVVVTKDGEPRHAAVSSPPRSNMPMRSTLPVPRPQRPALRLASQRPRRSATSSWPAPSSAAP